MITTLDSNYSSTSADTTSNTSTTSTTESSSNTDMTTEDFIAIMVEELRNQDPTSPEDSSAYIEQLNQLQNIEAVKAQTEAMENVSETIDDLSDLVYDMTYDSTFRNACSLIGSEVHGETDDGDGVEGTVESVELDNDTVYLKLSSGYSISYDSLESVTADS